MAGYIGSKASVVSSGTENKRVFDITTTTTSLTGLAYTPNQVNVFHNGVRLVDGTDFTATNGSTITLTTAAENGDQVVVIASSSFQISDTVSASAGGTFTGAVTFSGGVAGETSFTDAVEFNNTSHILIPRGTTAQRPASPAAGFVRHNTEYNAIESYDGSNWVFVGSQVAQYQVEYLVIAGGGSGGADSGRGAGGGAGGYRSSVSGEASGGGSSAEAPLTVTAGSSYTVTVGAGGANPSSGSNSAFGAITAIGGGRGGTAGGYNGASGGSGGGGIAYYSNTYGSGTAGQGYRGGTGVISAYGAGGGGGAGGVGGNGSGNVGGNGGAGVTSSITGTAVGRAGGGGGGWTAAGGGIATDGGANGASGLASAATANTGGGGGGGAGTNVGQGGSGVVIIRYLGAQKGTGGTVTSSGGYTIHTFTSSGTYIA